MNESALPLVQCNSVPEREEVVLVQLYGFAGSGDYRGTIATDSLGIVSKSANEVCRPLNRGHIEEKVNVASCLQRVVSL